MPEKTSVSFTLLHLGFSLRVPPDELLAHAQEAAATTASVDGLIWKIWILRKEDPEMGGIYLFADRRAAEAWLRHPVLQAVRSNSNVVSTQWQLWEVDNSLSALTRGPLPGVSMLHSQREAVKAGGR